MGLNGQIELSSCFRPPVLPDAAIADPGEPGKPSLYANPEKGDGTSAREKSPQLSSCRIAKALVAFPAGCSANEVTFQ
jgi:hypothetical protein